VLMSSVVVFKKQPHTIDEFGFEKRVDNANVVDGI